MPYKFTVPEYKRVRVIVSTDAACEADDPFAIAHALLSPKLDVKAVIAEHFMGEGTMERSYAAAKHLLALMKSPVPVLHGQVWPKNGQISEGTQFIIDEARRDDPRRLFVLLMGATTTMADALRAAPDIQDKLTIVTIGGNAYGKDAWEMEISPIPAQTVFPARIIEQAGDLINDAGLLNNENGYLP